MLELSDMKTIHLEEQKGETRQTWVFLVCVMAGLGEAVLPLLWTLGETEGVIEGVTGPTPAAREAKRDIDYFSFTTYKK